MFNYDNHYKVLSQPHMLSDHEHAGVIHVAVDVVPKEISTLISYQACLGPANNTRQSPLNLSPRICPMICSAIIKISFPKTILYCFFSLWTKVLNYFWYSTFLAIQIY